MTAAARHRVAPWDAECQYVGALLGRPASSVRPFLRLVPDAAITDPLTRWAYELLRDVVADGQDPHVQTVARRGEVQPARDALRPGVAPSGRDLHRLGLHVLDLFRDALPGISIAERAHAVLDDAYRAAARAGAVKMQYLAETSPRTDELDAAWNALHATLTDLRARRDRCLAPTAPHT